MYVSVLTFIFIPLTILLVVVRGVRPPAGFVPKFLAATDPSWLDVETLVLVEIAECSVVCQDCNILLKEPRKYIFRISGRSCALTINKKCSIKGSVM